MQMSKRLCLVISVAILTAAIQGEVPAQVQDLTPPVLASFNINPSAIDVSTSSQNVTFTLRITDQLSGFQFGVFDFISPSGQQRKNTCCSPFPRISGDARDGIYEFSLAFPQFSEAGTWHVNSLTLTDVTGNTRSLSESDFIALGFPTQLEVAQNRPPVAVSFYLHDTSPSDDPPILFLDHTSPSGTTAKFKNSTAIKFTGGNPWKEVGGWAAAPSLTAGNLTALNDLHVWLGLKNSDDQGTRFDLRAEVYKNGVLVAAGETYCIQGVTRNPNLAKEAAVSFAPFSPVTLNGATDELSLKVLTRIGSNGAGGFCGGHSNAAGLRLYFDSVSRPSRFNAMIAP